MLKLSYEKCVCFIFLVILVFLSCSGFHTDRLVTLTDHNKKYPFTSSHSSSRSMHLNAQFDRSELVIMRNGAISASAGSGLWDRERELEKSGRRRRHARRRRPRRPRFCPGQDVASRAYRAHVVIEGVVRSKRHLPTNSSAADYAVTVEVKRIHRNDSLYRALNLTDIIRLKFANRQHKGCEDKRVHGLVPAKLSNGDFYVFFLESVGMHNYTVLGQPVPLPADPKQRKIIEKQIRDIVVRKRVKRAKIVSLKSSNTNVKFNENVTLTCEVRGNPPPVITWYRNGTELRRRKQENIRIKHVERSSTLTIQNFSWSDSGIYECRAKGVTGGAVSKNVTISLPHEFSSEVTECDSPTKEAYCLNGGLCVQIKSMKEVACKCLTGFTGRRCENKDISSQTSEI